MKKLFKMVTLVLLSIAVLNGCSSSKDKDIIDDPNKETKSYNGDIVDHCTMIRDGEFVDVCITSDRENLYFYLDDNSYELLDTAVLPMQSYTDNWHISEINLNDVTNDEYSDLSVHIIHADNSQTELVYVWNENDHFLFQANNSYFTRTSEIGDDTASVFRSYAGSWVSTEDNMYEGMSLEIDLEGNWELYSGNDLIDEGYLYVVEGEGTFVYSEKAGALDGGKIEFDGEKLFIDTVGYFSYAYEIAG